MTALSRRALYYLLVLVAATVVFAGLYSLGMAVWEGRPRPWYRSLEVVIQTFTTTGYGQDAPWQSPQMNVLVMVMQLAGIGFILSAVDVFVVPWLQEALRPTAPTKLPGCANHVIVCGYSSRVEVFIDEMEARDQDYVLVEPDADRAAELHEREYRVLRGDPTSAAVLERAHIGRARVLVADVADDENAAVALAAREAAPDVRVVTLAEDASLARYHRAAGADVALSPRQILGHSLASKVPVAAAANVEESIAEGSEIDLAELVVPPQSPLHGQSLSDARLPDRFGVRVVGGWRHGTFETPMAPDTALDEHTRLFVAGTTDQLAALRDEMAPYVRAFVPQSIVLAGYGDSGQAAFESLQAVQGEVTVLDQVDREGVDIVGDARDPDVLRAAGIETASTLIVAVRDDTVATFIVLIARDLNPELQILVRAQDEKGLQNLRRAGADFVEAVPVVCGRMLAATVFGEERPLSPDRHVTVVRRAVSELAGRAWTEVSPEAQSNYSVLAVVRDGAFLTDADDLVVREGDELIVAGTDDGLQQFEERVDEAARDG